MLRRLKAQAVPDAALHQRAVADLAPRLDTWWGGSLPPLSRFSDSPPAKMPTALPADPVELLIVRAISSTVGVAMFGVTADGAVFTTDNGAWDEDSRALFVTNLSPLLDEATDIFHHLTGAAGGRFIEHDGRFFTASLDDFKTATIVAQAPPFGSPFALVQSGKLGLWQRVRSFFRNWRDNGHVDESVMAPPPSDQQTGRETVQQLVVQFGAVPWPVSGVLSEMGYRVGRSGLAAAERREILRKVFEVELVATSPETENYIREWGTPHSRTRLRKMARCLGGFIEMAERKTKADMSEAIADWKSDLEWLRATYGS